MLQYGALPTNYPDPDPELDVLPLCQLAPGRLPGQLGDIIPHDVRGTGGQNKSSTCYMHVMKSILSDGQKLTK